MMSVISAEDIERWLALGKLWDTKNKLNQWKYLREVRYDEYNHAVKSGASDGMITVLDRELREIVDKVAELADEYEAQLNYVREKGWL
jgi:hypothetical protein